MARGQHGRRKAKRNPSGKAYGFYGTYPASRQSGGSTTDGSQDQTQGTTDQESSGS